MEFQLDKLFDSFEIQESYDILAITIIAFILGFLVAYLARTSRVLKLKRELRDKKKEIEALKEELKQKNDKLSLQEADIRRASLEIEELETKVSRIDNEKNGLYNEVYALNGELEKLQSANKTYVSTIDDLNEQILVFKSNPEPIAEKSEPGEERKDELAEIRSIYNATRNRLEAVENTISRLENENLSLKGEIKELKDRPTPPPTVIVESPPISLPVEETNPVGTGTRGQDDPIDLTLVADKGVLGEKIDVDHPNRDDLSLINGLGPFLEKQLNQIGVYTYEQISSWDTATINEVTQKIGYFDGRIEKDDWVGQAYRLHQLKINDPDALNKQKEGVQALTDLKLVEGIGPKIEQILKNAGIATLDQLAKADTSRLKEILDNAGDRYRIHDPGTWPAQARLASNGEWELLKEYQDELKGGREVSP